MRLHLLTWIEAEAHIAKDPTIILPIGSTEQHGPTGLLGTDALTADAVARAVGEASGTLVGPCLPVGMAVHHMGFAGTMTLQPTTLIALIRDCVTSLATHGFQRILFINGHGGNVPTLRSAFMEIHGARASDEAPDVHLSFRNWWDGKRVAAIVRDSFGRRDGAHATASEISLTQHLFPDCIKTGVLDPEVAPMGPIAGPADFRRRFPDGRMGSDPSLASPEIGERLLRAAVEDAIEAMGGLSDPA